MLNNNKSAIVPKSKKFHELKKAIVSPKTISYRRWSLDGAFRLPTQAPWTSRRCGALMHVAAGPPETKDGDIRCVRLICQPTNQQYCFLILNQHQPLATSQSAILFSYNKSAPSINHSQALGFLSISCFLAEHCEFWEPVTLTPSSARHDWMCCEKRAGDCLWDPTGRG